MQRELNTFSKYNCKNKIKIFQILYLRSSCPSQQVILAKSMYNFKILNVNIGFK